MLYSSAPYGCFGSNQGLCMSSCQACKSVSLCHLACMSITSVHPPFLMQMCDEDLGSALTGPTRGNPQGSGRSCAALCCDAARRARMAVLNDFEANGYGVTAVSEENLISLNEVPAKPQARPASRLGCALECCKGFYTFN